MAEAAQIVAKVGISRSPVVALDLDPQFCFSCLGLVAALGITDNGHARTCVRNIAGWKPLPAAPSTVTRLRPGKRD